MIESVVDSWTLMHVVLGYLVAFPFFWVRQRPLLWVLWILTAWEFLERCLGPEWGDPGVMHGLFNGIVDLLAGWVGAVLSLVVLAKVWPRVPADVKEALT